MNDGHHGPLHGHAPLPLPVGQGDTRDLLARLTGPLIVIDVGCRWGFEKKWAGLGAGVQLIGFDADAEECQSLTVSAGGLSVRFEALALGAAPGRGVLHLTSEPACSSLYAPDPEVIADRLELSCTAEVARIPVELTTLDTWFVSSGLDRVDFAKLDTQGSELDILRGAEGLLRHIRVLEIEVEFNPIYVGQPLFGDVDSFLRDRGFVLWRLGHLVHYGMADGLSGASMEDRQFFDSEPVVFPARGGQLFWGHAWYVRRDIAQGPDHRDSATALRDAVLTGVLGFEDLASRAISRSESSPLLDCESD